MTLYTPQQVADILDINYQTVLKYIKEGKLKAAKIGSNYRIRREDLERFLEENMTV